MKRTKIICTIGPASSSIEVLKNMIRAGMNVARFNMSHGTHESHHEMIENLKKARKELNASVAIMIDTNGPEVRLGDFASPVTLNKGQVFMLCEEKVMGDQRRAHVDFKDFSKCVSAGNIIFANDGLVKFKVLESGEGVVKLEVLTGGTLSSRKSLNIPGVMLKTPYLTEKDKSHLLFGIEEGASIYALSFVCCASDVLSVKKFLKDHGEEDAHLCSKIESELGVKNMDEIIDVSDSVMVARGDLGVEIPFERIPKIQKEIISKCTKKFKASITATEMLESMINNARPTRAEISDVANAVEDGSSCVMLSGETSVGKYPIESVEAMAKIATEREATMPYGEYVALEIRDAASALAHAANLLASDINADAIICVSKHGEIAKKISAFGPKARIFNLTKKKKTLGALAIYFDVTSILCDKVEKEDAAQDAAKDAAKFVKKLGYIKDGDSVIVVFEEDKSSQIGSFLCIAKA